MKNLKILSMNLGFGFIPIKDRNKKIILEEHIKKEDYDIVMLQGNFIGLNCKKMGYEKTNCNDKAVTLLKKGLSISSTDLASGSSLNINTLVTSYCCKPVAVINVNCKDNNLNVRLYDTLLNICERYSNPKSAFFVRRLIVSGRFPKDFDINNFCSMFDLEDISTKVGQESHAKNNKEMVNHFFMSKIIEKESVHKLVGMTEVSKIGEAYPIEVTLKKVLK